MTRLFLVDDHRVVRDGLAQALTAFGFQIVGEAGDGAAALASIIEMKPDVALVDVSLPTMDGIELTRAIASEQPTTKVVILSMYADTETLRSALAAGAVGYLLKDSCISEIAEVIGSVAAGRTESTLDSARRLLRGGPASAEEPVLSKREAEVLQLIAQGASTETVARRLYISVKTVKNHLANIYEKMDTTDRTQAVVAGLKLGIVRLR